MNRILQRSREDRSRQWSLYRYVIAEAREPGVFTDYMQSSSLYSLRVEFCRFCGIRIMSLLHETASGFITSAFSCFVSSSWFVVLF